MKLMKRSGIYQASNYKVTFDPKTNQAYSYKHWCFVAMIEGKLVFNNYRYSVTTSKHQSKVRSLLSSLGIKIDYEMPLPQGIETLSTLQELIDKAESYQWDEYLRNELKKQARYERAKHRKLVRKLEDYLENSVAFRDYKILPMQRFGSVNEVAVHQCVDSRSLEADVQNALNNFHRDGFGAVVFYV